MDGTERAAFASLWTDFIVEQFEDLLLTPAEATEVVRRSRYHVARQELTPGSGVRPAARVLHEHIKADELQKTLTQPMKVRSSGAYVLGFVNGRPGDEIGEVEALFGRRNPAHDAVRRLALFEEAEYRRVVPLVRKGLVTPFRLFLKRQ